MASSKGQNALINYASLHIYETERWWRLQKKIIKFYIKKKLNIILTSKICCYRLTHWKKNLITLIRNTVQPVRLFTNNWIRILIGYITR